MALNELIMSRAKESFSIRLGADSLEILSDLQIRYPLATRTAILAHAAAEGLRLLHAQTKTPPFKARAHRANPPNPE